MPERGATRWPAAQALAAILALLCLVVGLAAGRPDIAALATPPALLALAARVPSGRHLGAPPVIGAEGGTTAEGDVRLVLAPAEGTTPTARRLVAATLATPGRRSPADGLLLRDDEECPLLVEAPLSGEVSVLAYGTSVLGPDLSDPTPFVQAPPVRVGILPPVRARLARPVSQRLAGLTGSHVSRRPGEGGELRSVAPLQPGDPLRRIDWRATARRSTDQDRLMVRRQFADAEASVFLVVDPGQDVPAATDDWFAGTPRPWAAGSLHLARVAATAVAASYLSVGDRVGLDDLSGTRRALRTASGMRHLEQIRARLTGTAVSRRAGRRRDPVPPPGAVVLVFSAFVDGEAARLLHLWHAQGFLVVGVDCLPTLVRSESSPAQAGAVRLTLLRRSLGLDALRREGVAVLTAAGGGAGGGTGTGTPGIPEADDAGHGPAADHPARVDGDLVEGLLLLTRTARRRAGQGTLRPALTGTVRPAGKRTP